MDKIIRKRAPGGGRKKLMDKNNFTSWFNELLVAFLNAPIQKGTEVPHNLVPASVRRADIMLSMVALQRYFADPGVREVRKYFMVNPGARDRGLSVLTIKSGLPQVALLRYLEVHNLIDKVPTDEFSFVTAARLVRKFMIDQAINGEVPRYSEAEGGRWRRLRERSPRAVEHRAQNILSSLSSKEEAELLDELAVTALVQ